MKRMTMAEAIKGTAALFPSFITLVFQKYTSNGLFWLNVWVELKILSGFYLHLNLRIILMFSYQLFAERIMGFWGIFVLEQRKSRYYCDKYSQLEIITIV